MTKTLICTRKDCDHNNESQSINNFSKDKKRQSGHCSACKDCVKKYNLKNKEKITKRKKENYLKNKEIISQQAHDNYEKNKESRKMKSSKYYHDNKKNINLKRKNRYAENPNKHIEKSKEYYYNNKEKVANSNKLYYLKNKEHLDFTRSLWIKNNPGRVKAHKAKCAQLRKLRVPKWLTKDDHEQIIEIYNQANELKKSTGIIFHVDHIIPLQGETVSGLHVPDNLQILTEHENTSKGNTYI